MEVAHPPCAILNLAFVCEQGNIGRGGVNRRVIPGRREAASPESITTGSEQEAMA
jgi:hypothetical protein